MVTQAWKFMTPSLSKKGNSVYWDWSNKQDGTRIMEVFCADLTGHPSYIIVRITRDTEEDCEDEIDGQITDGYFENYYGKITYTEIKPDSVKLDLSRIRNILDEQKKVKVIDHEFLSHYSTSESLYTLAAIMSGLSICPAKLIDAETEADRWRMRANDPWGTREVTEEDRKGYEESLAKLSAARCDAITACETEVNRRLA